MVILKLENSASHGITSNLFELLLKALDLFMKFSLLNFSLVLKKQSPKKPILVHEVKRSHSREECLNFS